eukprot:UN2583
MRAHMNPSVHHVNTSDAEWFRSYFVADRDNKLEDLTMTSSETDPTLQQIANDQAKENAAVKVLRPRVLAEETEAQYYYEDVFPWDQDNDLDDYTRHRNWTFANHVDSANETVAKRKGY